MVFENIGETVEGLQRFPINMGHPSETRGSLDKLLKLPSSANAAHGWSYLGVDRNRFDAEVRPTLTEIPIGTRGRAFDRLELDEAANRVQQTRDRTTLLRVVNG